MEPVLLVSNLVSSLVNSPPPRSVSLLGLFKTTGVVGPLMLLVAAFGLLVALKRLMELRMSRLAPARSGAVLEQAAREGSKKLAASAAAETSLLGTLVAAAASQPANVEDMRAALDRALAREQLRRGNRMADITRLAWVVLLLGILGTVIGTIYTLETISIIKDPSPSDFATGIAESLTCSAFGLFFSLLLFGTFFLVDRTLTRKTLAVAGIAEEIARLAAPPA